jgi:hypothetical protein
MFIVDAGVHVNDIPGERAPYWDRSWRMSLEDLGKSSYPCLLVPGSPSLKTSRHSASAIGHVPEPYEAASTVRRAAGHFPLP